jgi:hypothetical protein
MSYNQANPRVPRDFRLFWVQLRTGIKIKNPQRVLYRTNIGLETPKCSLRMAPGLPSFLSLQFEQGQ